MRQSDLRTNRAHHRESAQHRKDNQEGQLRLLIPLSNE
jgi:hypothetical protein